MALSREDADAAEREIDATGENALAEHFQRKIEALRLAEARGNVPAALGTILRWAKRPAISPGRAKALLELADVFEKKHGRTELAATRRKELAAARLIARRVLVGAGLVPGAVEFSGHRYKLYRYPMPWGEARRFCERLGAHLVAITSKDENEFVTALARDADATVWIGFTDEREEGDWEWVTGEAPAFARWAPYRPLRNGSDHCRICKESDWKWEDRQSDHGEFLVCEWEPGRPLRGRARPTASSGSERPFEIPPGHRRVVLYREDFEDGTGGWGGEVARDALGAGKVLRLPGTPGGQYTSASSECSLRDRAFRATLKTRFSFKYRTEGGLTRPWSQHWLVSPEGSGHNYQVYLPASQGWAWVDFAAAQLMTYAKDPPDLTGGFKVTALKMPCGPPDQTGECYIDDFEVYDVVPEDAGR